MLCFLLFFFLFFFNDTATTEIYTLSLHDALPIYDGKSLWRFPTGDLIFSSPALDRKSTRLNSSHGYISYAVFCLKKKIYPKHLAHIRRPIPPQPAHTRFFHTA